MISKVIFRLRQSSYVLPFPEIFKIHTTIIKLKILYYFFQMTTTKCEWQLMLIILKACGNSLIRWIQSMHAQAPNFIILKDILALSCLLLFTHKARPFTYVSISKSSDNSIYSDSYLYQALWSGTLNIPQPLKLVVGEGNKIQNFFIGDDAFTLDRHLRKPYNRSLKLSVPSEIFNYWQHSARMTIKWAFGWLCNRFRIQTHWCAT